MVEANKWTWERWLIRYRQNMPQKRGLLRVHANKCLYSSSNERSAAPARFSQYPLATWSFTKGSSSPLHLDDTHYWIFFGCNFTRNLGQLSQNFQPITFWGARRPCCNLANLSRHALLSYPRYPINFNYLFTLSALSSNLGSLKRMMGCVPDYGQ